MVLTPRWIGCHPGNFRPGRANGHRPEAIVIHIMEGTLGGTDSWFGDPKSSVSAHYGIGQDGTIHQYVKEADTAFHAGTVDKPSWPQIKAGVNPNHYTIGIEHEGRDDIAWPWPPPMLEASRQLVREIAARWGFPVDAANVVTHHSIRHGKTCPGRNFKIAEYLAGLGAAAAPPAPPAAWTGGAVRALVNANLRRAASSASERVGGVLANATFEATGVLDGQAVQGNGRWFVDAEGRHLWAGATDRPTP
jgi:N-acetyl-anhydromuramyl-L-alanine amidase AmpD